MAKVKQSPQPIRGVGQSTAPQPVARNTFNTELELLAENLQTGHQEMSTLESLVASLIGYPENGEGTVSEAMPVPESVFERLSQSAGIAGGLGYRLERLVKRLQEAL